MDMSIIIVVWVVIMIVQGALEKKKPPPTNFPPQNNSPDFEIPTLANDPNFPGEESIIFSQNPTQSVEVREINLAEVYRQKKISAQSEIKNLQTTEPQKVEQKNFSLDLTPSATMNAIILGEILSKPKFRK